MVTDVPTPKTTPAPGNALHIAAGQAHTCVIASGGSVKCWGQNDRGQLGDGSNNQNSSVPVSVALTAPAVAIGAGAKHTCAVLESSGLKCWGNNNRGQLGDGTKTNRSTPVSVITLGANVVEVAGGAEHTCALLAGGSVWCWGRNDAGQLGTGTKLDSSVPVPVLLTGTATAIAAGDKYTCAAVTGVGIECWGQNGDGQLGDGTKVDHSLPALANGTGYPVRSVAAGLSHTCASFTNGSMMCWGDNGNGQLGNGTTADSLTPVPALAVGVQSVTVGRDFTCVTTLSSVVQCWGNDSQGQLGDSAAHADSSVPKLVSPLPADVLEIRSGQGHTCSLHISGAVYCWGQNTRGQLGNGGNNGSGIPVPVSGLP